MPSSSRSPATASRGKWLAAGLAVAVHAAFLLVLVFTVNWQNPKPEAVTAELYAPPSTAVKSEPARPEPPPEPIKPPVKEPEPAKPPPVRPPPDPPRKIEPLKPPSKAIAPPKADLALKDKQELERRKKDELERTRKEAEKKEVEKRDADKRAKEQQERVAEARERQSREAEALKAQADRERLLRERSSADSARARQDADYVRRIQSKVRGNVNVPPDIPGNPEAIFEVVQLPTGEILEAQLRKSSGVRAYDEAVQRAILKSSPLPQPDSADLFRRTLLLKFRPLD